MKKKTQVLVDRDTLLSIGAALIRANQKNYPIKEFGKATGIDPKQFFRQFDKEEGK